MYRKTSSVLVITIVLVVASLSTGSASAQNIVTNSSFELPANDFTWSTWNAGSNLDGWIIASGNVNHGGATGNYIQILDGVQMVDLNGNMPGSIYQDLATVSGQTYQLSFFLAGNTGDGPIVKELEVDWGGVSLGDVYFDTTGKSDSNMGWQTKSFLVMASGVTTRLEFSSLTPGAYGPYIDNVIASPIPEPATLLLLGLGAVILRKRKK
jgi:choice-of-anchor C domain-containing protein